MWYDDGSSFSDQDGLPHEAPRWGAVVVAAYSKDHGRMLWHGRGADYFLFEDGEWICGDFTGLLDYLTRPGDKKVVLIGRHIPPGRFWPLYERANVDPRLPPRSSRDPLEE